MSGLYTNGMTELVTAIENARLPVDTNLSGGQVPETAALSLFRLATMLAFLGSNVDRATVAGSRYYRKFTLESSALLNGVAFLVGSVGGTDKIIVELHNSSGALVATSDLAGVTLGVANTWQEIPFGAAVASPVPVELPAGTYYITLQSNGTTGKLRAYNATGLTLPVGSATGTFGTSAAITPPTAYTAGVGPVSEVY